MKSVSELEEIRKKALEDMQIRKNKGGKKIVIGMATCGIAAGARQVMLAFVEELNKRGIKDTTVTMTGCIGLCRLEPIVEVFEPDGSKVTYVKMTSEKAARVVAEHIVNRRISSDLTIGNSEKKD